MTNSNQYWATVDTDEIGSEILKRVEDYEKYLVSSGRLQLWRHSYDYYYKPVSRGAKLNRDGEQGEYTSMDVNHYRNLLTHLKTMTTQNRPAFEPRSTNSDFKSMSQTVLAASLLDYYMREKSLEMHIKNAVEHALVFGEGFIKCEWDSELGEIYDENPETSAPIRAGDIRYFNLTPLDVARDYSKTDANSHQWYIVKSYANKWDLAAKFPEFEDKILNLSRDDLFDRATGFTNYNYEDSDDIPIYELFHKPTSAVTNGRYSLCVDGDIVLLDGPLPYRELPLYRIAPDEQINSCFGYTVGFDLLPVQEAINGLYSTIITNQSSFGVQNITVQSGSNLSVSSISGGLNLIEYDGAGGKPEPLNLTQTPPEIFNFINQLEDLAQVLSGVNSVARGDPQASLQSGSALALVQSMAIQFSIGLQQAYSHLLENVGTATINILRDYAATPRIAIIAGKSQRALMREFTGDDLDQINRVVVDQGSALSRTSAGKVQLAENLVNMGMINTAQEYLMVLATGQLRPMVEGQEAELLNIKAENEELSEGRQVPVMITDSHQIHVQEHRAILSSPEARRDPTLIKAVTEHIQEHLNFLADPDNATFFQILGQEPIPQPAKISDEAKSQTAEVLNAENPVTQKAGTVNQPLSPQNPMTGERPQLAKGSAGRSVPKSEGGDQGGGQ